MNPSANKVVLSISFLFFLQLVRSFSSDSFSSSQQKQHTLPLPYHDTTPEHVQSRLVSPGSNQSRRGALDILCTVPLAALSITFLYPPGIALAATDNTNNLLVLRLETPEDKAGLVLQDVVIGNPPRTVVSIQQVLPSNRRKLSGNVKLQPGLILRSDKSAQQIVERLQTGPYPIELAFYNLDSTNGELGEALTAQDALQMSRRQTAMDSRRSGNSDAIPPPPPPGSTFDIKTLQSAPSSCRIQSQRDDVIEIEYEARIGGPDGTIYDASAFRGTGRPYQMVLGSGDMIPGVDQSLYDMCVGEVRQLDIPPNLAYGTKGNKLFRIPSDTNSVWHVELVSISSMRQPAVGDD